MSATCQIAPEYTRDRRARRRMPIEQQLKVRLAAVRELQIFRTQIVQDIRAKELT